MYKAADDGNILFSPDYATPADAKSANKKLTRVSLTESSPFVSYVKAWELEYCGYISQHGDSDRLEITRSTQTFDATQLVLVSVMLVSCVVMQSKRRSIGQVQTVSH